MEGGARREGKSAYEIAALYTNAFKADLDKLNILYPATWCKATENIQEQIDLIKVLEEKGYTYKTKDGVYFDTKKINNYNKLSHLPLDELKEGARVEKNPDKKNPTDFALWKFSLLGSQRQMEWESPWGIGFPGWHIECSAMSLKYLKNNLDIHCGGIDHINIHHTNEIAQSEAATGKKFFNYWLHGAFLNVGGDKKMAKSDDNFLTLDKVSTDKGIDPLAYRYAASQVHYRKPMEYSEESLKQAQNALEGFRTQVAALGEDVGKVDSVFKEEFLKVINDDLNIKQNLALLEGSDTPISIDNKYLEYFNHFRLAVEQNFSKTRDAKVYASELSISYKHLNEVCKQVVKVTAKSFINNYVILEAKRMLVSTSLSVKEIAFAIGFSEPTNFLKYFKKHTSLTPVEFRNTLA
jgi:cysteinyl-tRNA synthetase